MLVWIIIAGVWVIDRLLKIVVQMHMVPGESLVVIPKVFHITYVLNPGAAFGLMAGRTWIFIAAALIVVLGVLYAQNKVARQQVLLRVVMGMIGGGALGNLYDRVKFGVVVDYLDFRIWPFVFNFADSMIVIGVGLLLLHVYRQEAGNAKKGNDKRQESVLKYSSTQVLRNQELENQESRVGNKESEFRSQESE